jgi:hypothetical protein
MSVVECSDVSCEHAATQGGIFTVQPNGLTPTHAIYYACDGHAGTLSAALETWPVAKGGAR